MSSQADREYYRRTGTSIPGYTGYIPGKRPEGDLIGSTFARANRSAMTGDRSFSGPLGHSATPRGFDPPPRSSPRLGQLIPGYTGYIPGKRPEPDALGKTFADMNDRVASGPKEKPSPSYVPDYERLQASQAVKGTGHAVVAVPGYCGHIPGKKAENVVGLAYTAANKEAAEEFASVTYRGETGARHQWKRTQGPEVESRCGSVAGPGINVPGYTGFVPGKVAEAENMGKRFAEANQAGNMIHKFNKGISVQGYARTDASRSTCSRDDDASSYLSQGRRGQQRPQTARSEASLPSSNSRLSYGQNPACGTLNPAAGVTGGTLRPAPQTARRSGETSYGTQNPAAAVTGNTLPMRGGTPQTARRSGDVVSTSSAGRSRDQGRGRRVT